MNLIEFGDCRETMRRWAAEGVKAQMCVTSPPYFGLRSYLPDDSPDKPLEIGLEETPEQYVARMVDVFRCVRDVLADDGTLWVNLGSSYASGDKTPSQSLLRQRVPSCDTHGTAPQDSQAAGRACLGSYDESLGATRFHRENNAHICRCAEQVEQQIEPTSQGNERLGCDQSSRLTFQPDAHQSTTGATSQNAQDALRLSGEALACQQEPRTSLRDAQECADKSACTSGTSRMLQPLAVHTKGKESFFSACRRSDCYGIGRCGYCFSSLTMASLNFKQKDELNIPHLVAMALQADGWVLRQTICWAKPNPMPESVRDRCTKAHEYVFLLSKSERYFFDSEAMKEPAVGGATGAAASFKRTGSKREQTIPGQGYGTHRAEREDVAYNQTRNRRSVWTVATRPYKGAHFATFPPALIEPCILAGTSERGHCPACGARWVRDTGRECLKCGDFVPTQAKSCGGCGHVNDWKSGRIVSEAHLATDWSTPGNGTPRHPGGFSNNTVARGWRPTCTCGCDPVPDIVLDPFMGSGTTAAVALQHGRQYLGCELNPAYQPLQQERISNAVGPLFV